MRILWGNLRVPVPMSFSESSFEDVSPAYYEGLADELDLLAQSVRSHPDLSAHFAERLHELARQVREDVRVMRVKAKVA